MDERCDPEPNAEGSDNVGDGTELQRDRGRAARGDHRVAETPHRANHVRCHGHHHTGDQSDAKYREPRSATVEDPLEGRPASLDHSREQGRRQNRRGRSNEKVAHETGPVTRYCRDDDQYGDVNGRQREDTRQQSVDPVRQRGQQPGDAVAERCRITTLDRGGKDDQTGDHESQHIRRSAAAFLVAGRCEHGERAQLNVVGERRTLRGRRHRRIVAQAVSGFWDRQSATGQRCGWPDGAATVVRCALLCVDPHALGEPGAVT